MENRRIHRVSFHRPEFRRIPRPLCIYRVPFQRDRILSRFIPQKRITIPNASEEAFVIPSGTCSFIKISRSVFAIPFPPMDSLLSAEYVPFNRRPRTVQCTRCAVCPPFFPVTLLHFSYDPLRGAASMNRLKSAAPRFPSRSTGVSRTRTF